MKTAALAPSGRRKSFAGWVATIALLTAFIVSREFRNRGQYHKQKLPLDTSSAVAPQIMDGSFENSQYTNRFFQFSIKVPENWGSTGNSESAERQQLNWEVLSRQDAVTRKQIQASHTKTPTLVTFGPKDGLIAETLPPVLKILAEDVSQTSSMSSEGYLEITERSFSQVRGFTANFGPVYRIQCQGGQLEARDARVQGVSVDGYMTFAVTIRKGYALSFIQSAGTLETNTQMKEFLKGITFE